MLLPALLFGVCFGLMVYFAASRLIPGSRQQDQAARMRTDLPDLTYLLNPKSILKDDKKVSEVELFRRFLMNRGIAEKISVMLKTAKWKMSVAVFILLCFVTGSLSFLFLKLATKSFVGPLFTGIFLGFSPYLYISFCRRRYLAKFAEFLPDALSTLSRSIKAGRSLEGSIDVVAQTSPKPISEEFEAVRAEVKLGVPIEQALQGLQKRVDNPSVKILTTGIAIHRELGGNLSEILNNLEVTIRERFAITREIETLSSQGRYSALLLFSLPFVLLIFYALSTPETFWKFAGSNFGGGMIWFTMAINVAALFWMQKLVKLSD